MHRPTPADLAAAEGREVPDLLGPGLRLLVVGINPGLWTAAVQAHFARPGNRFWPAVADAGLTDHLVDCAAGMSESDREHVIARGLGITNLAPRATARAAELTDAELVAGRQRLLDVVRTHRPRVVAICGVTAFRVALERPKAALGEQTHGLSDGATERLWVLPNPSGLNAHVTRAGLAVAFAEVGRAAGILPAPRRAEWV